MTDQYSSISVGSHALFTVTFHRIANVHTQGAFAQGGIGLTLSATLQLSGITNYSTCRATGAAPSSTPLLNALDKLESCLHAFLGCHDAEGVQNAARLVWNAGLPLLNQTRSKQTKRTFTSAAQALAAVASPLHRLRSACSNDSCLAVSAAPTWSRFAVSPDKFVRTHMIIMSISPNVCTKNV